MIKLTLSDGRGPVLLNPAHIVAVKESRSSAVTIVLTACGEVFEVREPLPEVAAKFPREFGL